MTKSDYRTDFILLYACDVREHPEAYKERVRAAPEASAFDLTEGLTQSECGQLLRDLRAERRLVAKTANQKLANSPFSTI